MPEGLGGAMLAAVAELRPGERGIGECGENRPVTRTDLIHRAIAAFLEYGRGAVVILFDDPEPLYVLADEAVQQLSEWQAEPALIAAVARATDGLRPGARGGRRPRGRHQLHRVDRAARRNEGGRDGHLVVRELATPAIAVPGGGGRAPVNED